jgi:hypothetical protein
MIGDFLDKIHGFLDSRFIVSYLAPVFVALGLIWISLVIHFGWVSSRKCLLGIETSDQAMMGGTLLFLVTLLSYLLQAWTGPIIRFYEGYTWPKWLANLLQKALSERRSSKNDFNRHIYFPRNEALDRPTRLGNILTAAEEHSYQLYRLEAIYWWPRLTPLLSEAFRAQIDTAFTPLIALLNLSFLFTLLALSIALASILFTLLALSLALSLALPIPIFLIIKEVDPWLILGGFCGATLMATSAYLAATYQAVGYGNTIRVAFDLYRHEILRQMHIRVPDNLVEERLLWEALNRWIFDYTNPWTTKETMSVPADFKTLNHPFSYDFQQAPAASESDHMHLKVDASVALNLKDQEKSKD